MATQGQRFKNKVVVVTGGNSGIGKALAEAFVKEGGRVVVADLLHEEDAASTPAWWTYTCDVTDPLQVREMIRAVRQKWGRIDIYCSNAGIMIHPPLPPTKGTTVAAALDDHVARLSDAQWDRVFRVNVQSHVIAIRELITDEDPWDGGIFVITASAAGLLAMLEDACYGTSKAAAVSFAEHLAIVHPQIQVHCLCPQSVDTAFIPEKLRHVPNSAVADGLVTPAQVAACTLDGIEKHSFWIFPHKKVPQYVQIKATQHERWLQGMQRFRERLRRGHEGNVMESKIHSKL